MLCRAGDRVPPGWGGYPWIDFTDGARRRTAEAELRGRVASRVGETPSAGHFDVFVSYAHVDLASVRSLVAALQKAGLAVWFDEREIGDFASITRSIEDGLARSKALVAFYSVAYQVEDDIPSCLQAHLSHRALELWRGRHIELTFERDRRVLWCGVDRDVQAILDCWSLAVVPGAGARSARP